MLDIPDMLAIALVCYKDFPFDQRKAVEWAQSALMDPSFGIFRDNDSWGAAKVFDVWWEPQPRAMSMFLTCRDKKSWDAVRVLRAMIEWSRGKGASQFAFGEETGMRMEALAKRVGASRDRPSYKVSLVAKPAAWSFLHQRSAA
jgi:hypothetical protein